jgi:hypothetical protein
LASRFTYGRSKEHVRVAMKALGKELPPRSEVHHVNGDATDNRASNLVICQDHAYHFLLHVRTAVLKAGGNPNTDRMCYACKRPVPIPEFGAIRLASGGSTKRACLKCAAARKRAAWWRRKHGEMQETFISEMRATR